MRGIISALAADMAGDAAARDAAIKKVRARPRPGSPKIAAIFGIIGDWLAAGDKSPLDLDRLRPIFESIPKASRPNAFALTGLFLDRHGKTEPAIDYLKQADSPDCFDWFRLLARHTLRARKVELAAFPW